MRRRGRRLAGIQARSAGAILGAQVNMVLSSEDLGNETYWSKNNVALTTSPANDLTQNRVYLTRLDADGANFRHIEQTSVLTVPTGGKIAWSCYQIAGTSPRTAMRLDSPGGSWAAPMTWSAGVPSYNAGTETNWSTVSREIDDLGDGLYRFRCVAQNDVGSDQAVALRCYESWNQGTAGAEYAYFGGVQAEVGALCSAYVKTTTFKVTGQ